MNYNNSGDQLQTIERMLENKEGAFTNIELMMYYCIKHWIARHEATPIPVTTTLAPLPLDCYLGEEQGQSVDLLPLSSRPIPIASSVLDGIFHPAIDVEKVKTELLSLTSDKVDGIKRWFVLHKVLEEINWLSDCADSHFIKWVSDCFGWEWSTKDFKRVLPDFKNTPTMEWGKDTVKDVQTGLSYRALADKVRSRFVSMNNGNIIDNTYYFKRPDLYIHHPGNRR